jgi:hypothetical protein
MQAFMGGRKMRAIELYINGRYLLTAGVGWDGLLLPSIAYSRGEFRLHIGGIDRDTDEHVDWSVPEIGVGDEITFKLVETDQISPVDRRDPVERNSPDEPPILMAPSD